MDIPMKTITIKGKEYPYKCSNYVLALIQEKYGNLSDFEIKLSGKKPLLDKNGEQKRNDEGQKLYELTEPSMSAINFMLPLVINEGIEIEADEQNKEVNKLKERYIIRNVELGMYELSKLLCEEFYKAIISKKQIPSSNQEMTETIN